MSKYKWKNSEKIEKNLSTIGYLGFNANISDIQNEDSPLYIMGVPQLSDPVIVTEGMLRYDSWHKSGVEEVFYIDFLNPINGKREKDVLMVERAGNVLEPRIIHSLPTISEVKYAILLVINYLEDRDNSTSFSSN